MAKQVKKASLLSEAERQKLLKKAGNKKPITQAPTQTATMPLERSVSRPARRSASADRADQAVGSSTGLKAKLIIALIVLSLTLFVIAPKPLLLEYQSSGLITKSIYMPGWFGKPGTILDTNQRAVLAEEEQSLYLCFEGQTNEQCAKYQLRQQQGFIAAAFFWYSSHN